MSDSIRSAVSEFLTQKGITFTAVYVGQVSRPQDGGKAWDADEWRITFRNNGTYAAPVRKGEADIVQPYFTGLGHRKVSKGQEAMLKRELQNMHRSRHAEITARYAKPQAPDAAGVLHSLLMDGEAADMSFPDWCDTFGSDSDSLKALNTYNQCCAIGQKLRKFFSHAERETLREMLQDY